MGATARVYKKSTRDMFQSNTDGVRRTGSLTWATIHKCVTSTQKHAMAERTSSWVDPKKGSNDGS